MEQTKAKVMGIPHLVHGCWWDKYVHDPRYVRVMEIFQACRVASEGPRAPRSTTKEDFAGFAQYGLAMGHRFGFICSTDHFYGACYACVYAESLSRDHVFDGLYQRRCYGSTAYGIVIDFRADGHFMGEEYSRDLSEGGARLSIYVRAYADVRRVDIVRYDPNAQKWGSIYASAYADVRRTGIVRHDPNARKWGTHGSPKGLGRTECRGEWVEENPGGGTFIYYLRVTLDDEEMAWSSPVWVTYIDK
jgi:hypothetical protein